MTRRSGLSILLVILLALASVLGLAAPGRAAQAGPSWTPGDSWTWRSIYGSAASTLTWTVEQKTTLTVSSGTYSVWKVHQTLVTSGPLANETDTGSLWIGTGGFTVFRESLQTDQGFFATSWNPPLPLAEFPLEGSAWTLTTNETHTTPTWVGSEDHSVTVTYYGQALAEAATTVPAGTFHPVPVQLSMGAGLSTVRYYSDEVGNFILVEDYDLGTVVRTQSLLEYRYQSPALTWLLLGLGIAAITGVVCWVLLRRLRHRSITREGRPPAETERRS